MEKEFLSYELALKLKELGFNEVCLANYNNLTGNTRLLLGKTDEGCITWNKTPDKYNTIINSNERILAPLWQQAFDWFREKYNYHYEIFLSNEHPYSKFHYRIMQIGKYFTLSYDDFEGTYEEARLACLEKLIELCKKN